MMRTDYCGALREKDVGRTVTAAGWVQTKRDMGGVIFIDLKDREGTLQVVLGQQHLTPEDFAAAEKLRNQSVIQVTGNIRIRSADTYNPRLQTGTIELMAEKLVVLSQASQLPFDLDDNVQVREDLRLKYRYLDLRRSSLYQNLKTRHKLVRVVEDFLDERGFLNVETPMLCKSTPEGARDYLVPSRVHPGSFYALPQSPQIYKQLLMVGGIDRYYQIARCFRDEDLRADRQPEFTQIDLEMSFATQEDIMAMNEGFIKRVFKEVLGLEIALPMHRMTYADAMNLYGSDKPDTRFGMEIQNVSETVRELPVPMFSAALEFGGSVRALVAKNAATVLSRKEIDKLTEHAKGIGAKGLAYIRWTEDAPSCSFGKFLDENQLNSLISALCLQKGDVALFCADKNKVVLPTLGAIRTILGKKLDLIPEGKFNFLWITEFPFFEWNEDTNHWDAMHHPFTMPLEECLPYLESDPGKVRALCYDMVLNGTELLSGSIRITDWQLQERMFRALGLTEEDIQRKFGFLVEAYKYGAPPHGGSGMGLDRLAMVMCGADSLRDVVAFPKVQNASELMSQCPSPADPADLAALGITLVQEQEK